MYLESVVRLTLQLHSEMLHRRCRPLFKRDIRASYQSASQRERQKYLFKQKICQADTVRPNPALVVRNVASAVISSFTLPIRVKETQYEPSFSNLARIVEFNKRGDVT